MSSYALAAGVTGFVTMQAYRLVFAFLVLLVAQPSEGARVFGTETDAAGVTPSAINDAPWFCRGSPCPEFKIIGQTQTYELREYAESMLRLSVASNSWEASYTSFPARATASMTLIIMLCAGTWISTTVESSNYEVNSSDIITSPQSRAFVPLSLVKMASLEATRL